MIMIIFIILFLFLRTRKEAAGRRDEGGVRAEVHRYTRLACTPMAQKWL